ncbi:hypothetical protein [Algoriphagus winogradskyi]|uniref:Lipoprotein n=1 Tax=Algoriphagus winogradskyi TaxID=237017 RepID=A0ABY1NG83_9BACT|nr:hypothetical protein [Algoriphagus winogradskyi]SMP08739.1 hypothetical protein SAMN06265367_101792 [Algoriphagus winogradskyi]
MKSGLLFLLIFSLLFFSCNDKENVLPRTNPRFSTPSVQVINQSEVEFIAQVYDYGSDEIIEYGFVFNNRSQLEIGKDQVVKGSGRPEKSFRLVSNHSFEISKTYYVVAFIKTNKSVIYSQAIPFNSK